MTHASEEDADQVGEAPGGGSGQLNDSYHPQLSPPLWVLASAPTPSSTRPGVLEE